MHVHDRATTVGIVPPRTAPLRISGQLYRNGLKRLVDVVLVLLSLPLILPALVCLAVLIRLSDGKSAFFGHTRVGQNGRRFRCWKLRTMMPDADLILARHLATDPAAAREWAERRKLEHDPRVTRIGRILRCSSLDELPQLWNVLRGEMSLVGPRPLTPEEVEQYGPDARHYCAVQPGITGLWQVQGRNGLRFRERVAFDVTYARSVSPDLDFKILLRTFRVVLAGTGV